MRPTILACLCGLLMLSLASCKCGEGAEQLRDTAAASDVDDENVAAAKPAKPTDPKKQVECPVCGLRFGAGEATASHVHEGTTYHFLLEDHKQAFAADPASYLDKMDP